MIHTPKTETELGEIVKEAAASATPLEITGGGSRKALGRPVQAAAQVTSAGFGGVSLYEPGELTLVVGAGMPLAEIDALLEGENQQLTFEPPDYRALLGLSGEPTLGGVVATAGSGPRRLRMGACRDALLGVRFISGDGQIHHSGGRVMKNVTGYDLTRLMCGAYGTLGVLTQVGLKVMPRAEIVATLAIHGLSDETAVAALAKALQMPVDVSAAAHLPESVARELGFTAAATLLRVEGFETQANYRMAQLIEELGLHGTVGRIDSDPWPAIRDVMMFAGDARAVWRVSVAPMDGPKLVAALRDVMDVEAFYDWGGGLVWLACAAGDDASAAVIRSALAVFGGHATLMRAPDTIRAAIEVFEPEPLPLARLSVGLKSKFDPAGILNPGRMRA